MKSNLVFKKQSKRFSNDGFVAIVSITVFGLVALVIAGSVFLNTISDQAMNLDYSQSVQALSWASLCTGEALAALKADINYVGNETITGEKGECSILAIESPSSVEKTIKSEGLVGGYRKRILTEVTYNEINLEVTAQYEVKSF